MAEGLGDTGPGENWSDLAVSLSTMGRRYLNRGEAMRRLVEFIQRYQERNGVAPATYTVLAEAVGTSRSQAKRLLHLAEAAGLLRRPNETPLRFDIILSPPHLPGIVRIPLIECFWSQRIRWLDAPDRGVWLDRATYQIRGEADGLWAVVFPERPREGAAPALRLNEHALALVRSCRLADVEQGRWYLIEHRHRGLHRVVAACCIKRVAGALLIREGIGSTAPDCIHANTVGTIAEVLMVTTRPPTREAENTK